MTREEFLGFYPNCSYEGYVAGEEAIRAFYCRPAEEINRDLIAQADENRARGYTND
jgi:hypothetical protein